ncbi:hypothetical protein OS493_037454 [Desmophyllum pertusum]|uniref:Uncharacterized protein n=1 Tax=Desmophyllum pertusum TaxID=174260 RepID=A0A9W9ZV64_9CNID|nr:hypothetical protein OS493_037454 [Desmophyllum pertusum]
MIFLLDKIYAERDSLMLEDIERLQEETSVREERSFGSLKHPGNRLEPKKWQLNRQLQKEIKDNSILTQEGMKIVTEHNEMG